ncbi:MAG: PepSY domain-containing protein [Oscillospiraceae bacterium]|nr:PepSY domain-containing protein [Oscillospiraceae bacterium]
MKFRVLATLIIAALLLTGVAAAAADGTEYGVTTGTPAQTDAPAVAYLTAQEAETIALTHSGYTAEQVTGLRSEYDVDHGVAEYEIEFRGDDWEYDYTIHAETGEVLSCEEEYDAPKTAPAETVPAETKPAKAPETKAPETKPAATEAPATLLTADEAKAIALAHAGLTAEQVKKLEAEFDYDDGRPEYEVEFRYGGLEYSYEIHGETGKILDMEKDD